ncbi:MAG: N-acetyltransferase [Betaproteobacteria bacterium]|nr:N-acetyltransferase [Betaproteobacteria bacterium]
MSALNTRRIPSLSLLCAELNRLFRRMVKSTAPRTPCRIRSLRRSDKARYLAAVQARWSVFRTWLDLPKTEADFDRWIGGVRSSKDKVFAIWCTQPRQLAGIVELRGVWHENFKNCYIVYYAFEGHEGRGLISQGVRFACRYAFERLRLHRLEANIQPENLASKRLAMNCGFHYEGYSPKMLKYGGKWRDHERWARLRDQ